MKFVLLWLIGSIVYLISATSPEFTTMGVIAPLLFCFLTIIILRSLPSENFRTLIAYLLFFSTSILTFNNFLTPLTGAVNKSSNILLFGFSFYTIRSPNNMFRTFSKITAMNTGLCIGFKPDY